MILSWLGRIVSAVAVVFCCSLFLEFLTPDAEARAGRGRSSGRSSYNANKQSQNQQPANQNPGFNQSAATANSPMSNRGGLLRNVAAGMAGGFLGSMLFSSFGHAAGTSGAAGAGGIGMLEILLMLGLGFFVFRWWKSRQQSQLAYARTQNYRMAEAGGAPGHDFSTRLTGSAGGTLDTSKFLAFAGEPLEPEQATDIFFRIQGAWTRRDISAAGEFVTESMKEILESDLAELKRNREINRLENIAVRSARVMESWQEDGVTYSKVRFTANLLDYTLNEDSGSLVSGSMTDPVKFAEDWIFAKQHGSQNWRLDGIEQI